MTDQTPRIVPGSRVVMHLALTLADGTEALSTFGEEPLEVVLGDGTLRPGLELALYGMGPGESDEVTLSPDQAYGWPDPDQIHTVPHGDFAEPHQVAPGQVIGFTLPSGEELAGTVVEIGQHGVQIDFNHPLAGHEVRMKVHVIAVEPPCAAEAEPG
jgi:FKBP-type peptidyl-prolyl cis-trans isomerase SlpA